MIQAHVKKQFDAAIGNVESALRDLSERLESLPVTGRPRNSFRRAGRTLRRTAGSFADHVPLERASAIAADTGRSVRQHPVTAALTAAVAGYCIWSLIQYSASRSGAGRRFAARRDEQSEGRFGDDAEAQDSSTQGASPDAEAAGLSRH
jgi:hypothetical protein